MVTFYQNRILLGRRSCVMMILGNGPNTSAGAEGTSMSPTVMTPHGLNVLPMGITFVISRFEHSRRRHPPCTMSDSLQDRFNNASSTQVALGTLGAVGVAYIAAKIIADPEGTLTPACRPLHGCVGMDAWPCAYLAQA